MLDGTGTTLREYIYRGDQQIALINNGTIYYIHNDHLNTPQVITNQSQQVVWKGDYEPFGKLASNPSNSIEIFSRFPGQYLDGETGLYYNYFRDYDPIIGRYIESDPIGLRGGINTYAYVGGNPIMWMDPKGLHYMGVKVDFSDYFVVLHYAKNENIPTYEGVYKIDNAPCTFLRFWRDEDFRPNAPDVPPPWEPTIPIPKPEQAWCEQ